MSISGRLLDYDTGEPVDGLAVTANQKRSAGFGASLWPMGEYAKTEEKGRFRITGLPPGDFYLKIAPGQLKIVIDPKPVDDFRQERRMTYAQAWYPGVDQLDQAAAVKLTGGNIEDLDIKLAKRRTASIRGRIVGEGAIDLTLFAIERRLFSQSFRIVASENLKPGAGYEIDGISPGVYVLSAEADGQRAALNVDIAEENQDGMDLYLTRGVTVQGRVRIEGRDDPALPDETARVELAPMGREVLAHRQPVPAANRDGAFAVENVTPDRYVVKLSPAPQGYAVSEVRYNRAPCRNRICEILRTAEEQNLEIKLAAASGAVLVSVNDGSDPAAFASVLLMPEPVDREALPVTLQWAASNQQGKATFSGLVPDVYRIAAYRQGVLWADDRDLASRLAAGREVRITAKETAVAQTDVEPY
jgi:hypothetical protein